ncbi:MAG: ROK family protein, partial [Rectinema sp.]|nr:ROK family protein [Rectinema sp.]
RDRRWGAGGGSHICAYVTVGTGIGVGILSEGNIIEGISHPEAGHMRVPRLPEDHYEGCCLFHGDCLEGLASGPALWGRWGVDPATLPATHPAWELEATYLGMACANIVLIAAPDRIILGGGVGLREGLAQRVEANMRRFLGGYIEQVEELIAGEDHYVARAACGAEAGIFGALELARRGIGQQKY